MKKLLKFVGKILAFPFSIAINLIKIILLPLVLIHAFLSGESKTIKDKIKFTKDMIKFCINHIKDDKPFYFSLTNSYGDEEGGHLMIQGNYYASGDLKRETNILYEKLKK